MTTIIKKLQREFKDTLKQEKRNLRFHKEVGDDYFNNEGWVEALEYVLKQIEWAVLGLKPDIIKAMDSIGQYYLYRNFYHGNNGIFSITTPIRKVVFDKYDDVTNPDSGYHEAEGWELKVKFGRQDDTTNEVYTAKVYVSAEDIQAWLKDPKGEPCPEFHEQGVGNCCFDVHKKS